MNMTIRKADEKDFDKISKLLYQVQKVHSDARPDLFRQGAKKYDDNDLKDILEDGQKEIFVATDEQDSVVGYAFCIIELIDSSIQRKRKTLYIDDLCVDETVRGQHIGMALYDYVLEFAREIGCYNVTLNVWADNKDAVHFYEKIGMHIQKIGMEKILRSADDV
ncbi:MAG: N-acetyltransferase family protein [Lachnospiraceae bacterium]|uniref:GNAT family N-acetyltransferase n=1 Tax=Parablautia sp. Marseille-Q6255 TaxID=3039593 RepID=UPI002F425892